jgi:dipeptidase E
MGKIVVVGGGAMDKLETLSIDRHIVSLTRKKHPKALFIPTASSDSEVYAETFRNVYGDGLGCRVDVLYLLKRRPPAAELRKRILSADLIYIGGGNTLKMVRRWRLLGVDVWLKEAHKKGIILSGISAGGICWFEAGHSDSMSFYDPENWKYIGVKGLGLIKGIHCPHFNGATNGKKRRNSFVTFMKKYSEIGIAIDDHCAVEFGDKGYKVIRTKKNSSAYYVLKKRGKVVIDELP